MKDFDINNIDKKKIEHFTNDQINALYKLINWYRDPESKQVFCIDGVAGSGKSTLISQFTDIMGIQSFYSYAAFTGKAVNVLTSKGVPAVTIHKLIYNTKKLKNGEFEFRLKDVDEVTNKFKLLIIDEYSMIGKSLFRDLKSFGIKMILTGDSNQLQPVNDNSISVNIDARLNEVVRQEAGSPILMLASKVLNHQNIGYGALSEKVMIVHKEEIPDALLCDKNFQIICGYNSTRVDINTKIRKLEGHHTRYPEVGDRLVCTSNDWSIQLGPNMALTNGMQGTVEKIIFPEDLKYDEGEELKANKKKDPRWWTFYAEILFDGMPSSTPIYINRCCFDSIYKDMVDEEIGHWFEFGYAITGHKSQGSEYQNVLAFYEPVGDSDKWLYTVITRAKEGLILAI